MPSDFRLQTMNFMHRGLLKISGGRVGWNAADMPVLELTTIGRKSGQPRSVMLTSPHQEGGTIVLVASKAGEDHHPAWFLNLRHNPNVDVRTKTGTSKMTATVADADQRAVLWPMIIEKFENYADYQSKTDREIPLVFLDPAG